MTWNYLRFIEIYIKRSKYSDELFPMKNYCGQPNKVIGLGTVVLRKNNKIILE